MTPIQNSIAYIQGFEFGQDIAKKEMRLAVEAEREACAKVADGWPDYDVQGLAETIRARGEQA